MSTKETQKNVLDHIKYHTGLDLNISERRPKIYRRGGIKQFYVDVKERFCYNSQIILKLQRMANQSHIVKKIEMNGIKSIAIFLEEGI